MNYTLIFFLAIAVLIVIYFGQIYLSKFKLIGETNPLQSDSPESIKTWQVYYFHSPHCGACKKTTPVVNDHHERHEQVTSIDISSDLETAQKFNIKATPTTVFLENNVVTNVELGSSSLQSINDFINKHEP